MSKSRLFVAVQRRDLFRLALGFVPLLCAFPGRAGPDGGLIPDPKAKLEEPLIVRPTSETIIGASFAQ